MASIVSAVTGGAGSGNFGAAGVNYEASNAGLTNPVTEQDIWGYKNLAQQALGSQQALLDTTWNQGGYQKQLDVYNQLQNVANGTGPNPAQAMLANATAANTANQAALMAGQRGASQNVGLMARQAAMQGAANQQNAIGQGAQMQAQQSLAAMGQQGAMANQLASQNINAINNWTQASQNQENIILGQVAALNSARAGEQASINTSNAGLASAVAGGQMGMISGIMGGAGAAMGLAQGGMVPHMAEGGGVADTARPSGPRSRAGKFFQGYQQASQPQSNQPPTAQMGNAVGKGIGTGISKGFNSLFGSSAAPAQDAGPQMTAGQEADIYQSRKAQGLDTSDEAIKQQFNAFGSMGTNGYSDPNANLPIAAIDQPANNLPEDSVTLAKGGKVPAMVSPGEKYLAPKDVKKVEKGANPMEVGKTVPGKPVVGGAKNDYANDIVPASLDEGGIVLPRSVTQAKDPAAEAHKFVSAILAKQGKRIPKKDK